MTKRIGVMLSTGKDSVFAMHKMKEAGYDIVCLISVQSKNKDSYMFHTPSINLAKDQSEALEIPLITWKTEGEKEKELEDLKESLKHAKEKYTLDGIVTGALFSNYQKERIEKICNELGLKAHSPLWHMNQYDEMKEILDKGFKIIFTKIACEGLNKNWLGVLIDYEHLEKLKKLEEKHSINIAGEGGEFESFVLDAPMFKKKLEILDSEIIEEKENCAEFIIKKIKQIEK